MTARNGNGIWATVAKWMAALVAAGLVAVVSSSISLSWGASETARDAKSAVEAHIDKETDWQRSVDKQLDRLLTLALESKGDE